MIKEGHMPSFIRKRDPGRPADFLRDISAYQAPIGLDEKNISRRRVSKLKTASFVSRYDDGWLAADP